MTAISEAAGLLSVDERTVRAVLAVESRGSGVDRQGRLLILFEPHVFWRNLPEGRREQARAEGLAYPAWGTRKYPTDSYPIFQRAMAFDSEAACAAISMGAAQLLGENYRLCGFQSALDMYNTLRSGGESADMRAFARFILARKLAPALRARQWAVFARGYNGPRYQENHYDTKLAAAYERLGGRDAPRPPASGRTVADAAASATRRAATASSTAGAGLTAGAVTVAPVSGGHSSMWLLVALGVVVLGISIAVFVTMRPRAVPRHEEVLS